MSDSRKRIFVVEDQRLIAADLANTLKRLGYDVVGSAASGEQAVDEACKLGPDLILMDIRLQGAMDGIEAAAAIRKRADIPVVYLTAYADEETIRRAKLSSPLGYVVKPFNERELRAAIEIALYKHDTDRLLAEERVRREAAEEFRALVEGIKEHAIFRLGPDGRVQTWNVGAERIYGYQADEIIGKHSSIFFPPDERDSKKAANELEVAATYGRASDEGWRIKQDGVLFWANVAITALRDERAQLRGFAMVARDLTERKHREDRQAFLDRATVALAKSLQIRDTLQRVARLALPDLADWCIIDLTDESGQLVQIAVEHLDAGEQELARKLGLELPPERELGHGAYHVLRTGRSEVRPELEDLDWSGAPLELAYPRILRELGVLSYLCVPIQYGGRCSGVIHLLRASPPRRYQAADLAVAEEFARRAGLAIENARLFREAQEAIRARDEFLQIASHELKTPLTPLQMQLDGLVRTLAKAGVQNSHISSKLDTAIRQTVRLNRLVDSLLDVSRISGGRIVPELEEFNLTEMVREVVERCQSEAQKLHCELVLTSDRVILGKWDRLRLEQIVSNLLANALKYGAGKPIEVDVAESDDMIKVTVSDHGIGIAKDAMDRIFDRFERAVSPRHYGGLGLGLFIARQIAEAHGGTVQVESELGTGSTFTLALPRQNQG